MARAIDEIYDYWIPRRFRTAHGALIGVIGISARKVKERFLRDAALSSRRGY
jgi:hypothetical protein